MMVLLWLVQQLDDAQIEGGGVRLKDLSPSLRLLPAGGEQRQVEQGRGAVLQCQAEGGGAVLLVQDLRPDLGLPPQGVVDLDQVLVTVPAHRGGQAALADPAVAPALVGDGVAVLLKGELAGGHHVVHRLVEGEVIHPRVAQGQLKQLQKGDGTGGPVHDVEDQQLQVQVVLNKSDRGHDGAPSLQVMPLL